MALTKEEIKRKMTELFHEVEDITKVDGVDNLPGCEGMLIYEEPLIGFASADDPLFEEYKKPHVIGENYLTPREWLEDTETIISFFLPNNNHRKITDFSQSANHCFIISKTSVTGK